MREVDYGCQLDEPYGFPGDYQQSTAMLQCNYWYHKLFLFLIYCCILLKEKTTATAITTTASTTTTTTTTTATTTTTTTKFNCIYDTHIFNTEGVLLTFSRAFLRKSIKIGFEIPMKFITLVSKHKVSSPVEIMNWSISQGRRRPLRHYTVTTWVHWMTKHPDVSIKCFLITIIALYPLYFSTLWGVSHIRTFFSCRPMEIIVERPMPKKLFIRLRLSIYSDNQMITNV